MIRSLRKVWERSTEARLPNRGQPWWNGRSGHTFGGIGIPLTTLVLVVALIPSILQNAGKRSPNPPAADQPSAIGQSGDVVVSDVEPGNALARPASEATPASLVEGELPALDSTATSAAGIVADSPIPTATGTPVAEAERTPPLIQYLVADPSSIDGGIWVEVSLSKQTMVIFKGKTPIFRSRVSTGQPGFETPIGVFYVQRMLEHDDMDGEFLGEDYFYPDVPHVMYFTDVGHALHGVYWHDDFGMRLSHGCVGMPPEAAAYLFSMASVGMGMEIFH